MPILPSRSAVLTLLAIGLLDVRPVPAQSTDEFKSRLLNEAPTKWLEYKAFAKQLQGKASWRINNTRHGKAEPESQLEEEYKQNADSALVISLHSAGTVVDNHVLGMNSKYAFKLVRNGPSRDWMLEKLGGSLDTDITLSRDTVGDQVIDRLMDHFKVGGLYIAKVVSDASFVVKQILPVNSDGQELLRIDFDYQPQMAGGRSVSKMSGWMLLDPSHYWYIREYNVRNVGSDTVAISHGVNDVTLDKVGRPIIQRIQARMEGQRKEKTVLDERGTGDFELTVNPKVPDTAFTLSAFGLPEPAGVTWKRPRTWIWLVGAGVGAVLMSVLLFQARRRRLARPRS